MRWEAGPCPGVPSMRNHLSLAGWSLAAQQMHLCNLVNLQEPSSVHTYWISSSSFGGLVLLPYSQIPEVTGCLSFHCSCSCWCPYRLQKSPVLAPSLLQNSQVSQLKYLTVSPRPTRGKCLVRATGHRGTSQACLIT